MPRAIWKGAVSFGLVTIPVNLYSATRREREINFHLLHDKDKAPIDYKRFCSEENVEVDWDDIVKGYEYEKGHYVVLTDEDFEKAKVPGTQTFEIRDFVPADTIDFAYFESPYWLAPSRAGRKAYALLREALDKTGRVGIGTFVMRQREHLAAVRPAGNALMLTTMRFADEIRSADDLDVPERTKIDKREMDLARQLVDTFTGDFKPEQYKDTYRDTLRQLIAHKARGREIVAPKTAGPPKVVDLMEALRKSLTTPRPRTGAAAARARQRRRPARRTAA